MNKNEEYKPVFYENFQPVALNITRREWFAGMALQGIIAHVDKSVTVEVISDYAYYQADAMIARRKR